MKHAIGEIYNSHPKNVIILKIVDIKKEEMIVSRAV